jgi:hypothetical protein
MTYKNRNLVAKLKKSKWRLNPRWGRKQAAILILWFGNIDFILFLH